MGHFQEFSEEVQEAFKKTETNHINGTIQKGLDERKINPFWRCVKSGCQDFVGVTPLDGTTHK